MAFKKGVYNLRKYLKRESKECKEIDEKLGEKWHERNSTDIMQ